jgi:hypothetical protein
MDMTPNQLRLFTQTCAHLVVRTPEGDLANGACFHIGDGYFVTARHVVDGNAIEEINPFTEGYIKDTELRHRTDNLTEILIGDEIVRGYTLTHGVVRPIQGSYFHPDPRIDIAIVRFASIDRNTPSLLLPAFLDDAVGHLDFLLTKAVILGFPPIALSVHADLVAVTAEVNAVVDTYLDRYLRFILSAPPRGGFSGGPALHEYGFTLGVITESLDRNLSTAETGFMAVLSADTIIECMEAHRIEPEPQREQSAGG